MKQVSTRLTLKERLEFAGTAILMTVVVVVGFCFIMALLISRSVFSVFKRKDKENGGT
jgi:hypothetical protein